MFRARFSIELFDKAVYIYMNQPSREPILDFYLINPEMRLQIWKMKFYVYITCQLRPGLTYDT